MGFIQITFHHFSGIDLSNGMKVLLVSDAAAEKAAAAIAVDVGTMNDPWEFPGLAHFLEHMLFLGNKKFPQEDEYMKFIMSNGGNNNAMTEADATTYYFDISPEFLSGAMERLTEVVPSLKC